MIPQFLDLLHTHAPCYQPVSQPGIGKVALGASRVASRSVLSLGFLIRLQSAWRAGHRGGPQPATATHIPVLEGETAPLLPIPLMSSVAGNGQGAAAEGREGQKGRRRKRKPVSVCAAGVGEPASQSHRPGRVGPELPRSLHAAALRPAPDVVRWVSEVPSAPASCVLAQVRRALCRALQPDPGGDCGMKPPAPARLQAHGVQRGHLSALDCQPPGPTSLQ